MKDAKAVAWVIPLDDIHVPYEERVRQESYGDIDEMISSLQRFGQLQAIHVRPAKNRDDTEKKWILVEGGRRMKAFLKIANEGLDPPRGLSRGEIKASTEEDTVNELTALQMEYHANEDREDFTWMERAHFVRRIHDELVSQNEGDWNVMMTASFLNMSKSSIYNYLELTEDPEILEDEDIASSQSLRTAMKKTEIKKKKASRKKKVALREKRIAKEKQQSIKDSDETAEHDDVYLQNAKKLVHHADALEWMPQIEDEFFDWFHWDPPYGGEQGGGAFSAHEEIDDSEEYAKYLMSELLPEIHRTLDEDGWLALWFHPKHYEWVKSLLEDTGFWVNPYPCIWYKQDRNADGHEIKRFLVNAYECFFLASKTDGSVIQQPHFQNVFPHNMTPKAQRRHSMHKPAGLLAKVIQLLGPVASIGGDCSFGSGSIFEAAFDELRYCVGCETLEGNYHEALEIVERRLAEMGRKDLHISI